MRSLTIHYLTQDETMRLFAALASKRDQALFRVAYTYAQLTSNTKDEQARRIFASPQIVT